MLLREVLLLAADRRRGMPGRAPEVSFPARSPTHAVGHNPSSVWWPDSRRSLDLGGSRVNPAAAPGTLESPCVSPCSNVPAGLATIDAWSSPGL